MSDKEYKELLNLLREDNLTQYGIDKLYGEIVDRQIEKNKEIERLHSIIKEVRKYIQDRYDGEALTHTFDKCNVKELLEILDKVEENK